MDYQFNYGEGRHSQTGAFCKNLEEYLSSLVTGVWMENMSRDFRWRKICLRLKKGMEFKRIQAPAEHVAPAGELREAANTRPC